MIAIIGELMLFILSTISGLCAIWYGVALLSQKQFVGTFMVGMGLILLYLAYVLSEVLGW